MGGRKHPTKPAAVVEARRALGRVRDDGPAPFPSAPPKAELSDGYTTTLGEIRHRIGAARLQAVLDANATLVSLYWAIGRVIVTRQEAEGWGAKVIDRLSTDPRGAFPDMKGLSARNLNYMRAFAAAWPDAVIVQRALHILPWGVNVELLDALSNPQIRLWYAERAGREGWSRSISV